MPGCSVLGIGRTSQGEAPRDWGLRQKQTARRTWIGSRKDRMKGKFCEPSKKASQKVESSKTGAWRLPAFPPGQGKALKVKVAACAKAWSLQELSLEG